MNEQLILTLNSIAKHDTYLCHLVNCIGLACETCILSPTDYTCDSRTQYVNLLRSIVIMKL